MELIKLIWWFTDVALNLLSMFSSSASLLSFNILYFLDVDMCAIIADGEAYWGNRKKLVGYRQKIANDNL